MIQIYIPLWFYSNTTPPYLLWAAKKFTFHYGSILILIHLKKFKMTPIYIPLWFYSNYNNQLRQFYRDLFTFHYGSILINLTNPTALITNRFTFHYGSILIYHINYLNSYKIIYIPLWFYSNDMLLKSLK